MNHSHFSVFIITLSILYNPISSWAIAAENSPHPNPTDKVYPYDQIQLETHIAHGISIVAQKYPQTAEILQKLSSEMTTLCFLEQISNADTPVVLKFFAPWCKPCKRMVEPFKQFSIDHTHTCLCVEIDIEQCPPSLTQLFNITKFPTFVYLNHATEVTRTGTDSLEHMNELMHAIAPENIIYFQQIADQVLPKDAISTLAEKMGIERAQLEELSSNDIKFFYFILENPKPLITLYYHPLAEGYTEFCQQVEQIAIKHPNMFVLKVNIQNLSPVSLGSMNFESIPMISCTHHQELIGTITQRDALSELESYVQKMVN